MFKVVYKDGHGLVMTVYAVSENGGDGSELWFLINTSSGWDWINAHLVEPFKEGN